VELECHRQLHAGVNAMSAAVLDQNNSQTSDPYGYVFSVGVEWQQQVADGIGGLLSGIELYDSFPDTVQVRIGVGSGFYSGPYVFTTTATLSAPNAGPPADNFIDTSAANIVLTPGEQLVIDVSASNSSCSSPLAEGCFRACWGKSCVCWGRSI
jgi:hypothetical protein